MCLQVGTEQCFSCKLPLEVYHGVMQKTLFLFLFLTACSAPDTSSVVNSHFSVETEMATYDFVWPMLAEEVDAPQVAERLSMESILITNQAELEATLKKCNCGYVSSTYEVNYEKNGLLSITIWTESVGAYLDHQHYDLNFDLNTDSMLTVDDFILEEKQAELLSILDEKLQANIQANELDGEGSEEAQQDFTEMDLENFILTEEGMEWHHDFGFAHAFEAGEPDGKVRMSLDELEGFLVRGL